ncbi:TDP-N-acetylfucosamine:lipid II N-acetylfucosaminyltransferase [Proteinivorax hydrogeniformans]|uniref:TDP-N-acetylfucosamine:lipid II N-acetylfucosaminyltransferase n=1 Tax=Proteinivorax hydrogeniformans TaxID=1826727 RepID=A0AAU8HWU6_9FIRM
MILHIRRNEKFNNAYINFVNNNFNSKAHEFVIIGRDYGFKIPNNKNISDLKKINLQNLIRLLKKMYKAKKIIIHGLFNSRVLLILFLNPVLLKKVSWVVWGDDLYCYRNKNKSLKSKLREYVRKKSITNFGAVCTLVEGDFELARKWYDVKGQYKPAKYIDVKSRKCLIDMIKNEKRKVGDKTIIHLGNSATETNNHIEMLKILGKFKNENIEIRCPLSYGSEEYRDEVIRCGKNIFGDKFKPITHFIKKDKFYDLLNEVDIGVFNNDRQQGLGNINPLISLGKKVYLRSNTTVWDSLEGKGIKIYKLESVRQLNFKEFITFPSSDREWNKNLKLKDLENIKEVRKIWENIFNT